MIERVTAVEYVRPMDSGLPSIVNHKQPDGAIVTWLSLRRIATFVRRT